MKMDFSREKLEALFSNARKSTLSIAAIILTLIVSFSVYSIQGKKIESLRVTKNAELKKNEVLQGLLRSDKTIKLYKGLLGKKDAYTVMNNITNIVKGSKVKLISLKPDNEIDAPLYIKYPFNLIVATDSFHAVGELVSNIENYPDMFFIDAITIKTQEENHIQGKEPAQEPKPAEKINVTLTLSIIAFRN